MDTYAVARRVRPIGLPLLFFVVTCCAWEFFVQIAGLPKYVLPAPSAVWSAFAANAEMLLKDLLITMAEAVCGFVLANIMALLVATIFVHYRPLEVGMYPWAIALKTTPIIAMAPLLVIWFGTGWTSKIVASAVICFFPMLVNAIGGLRNVDESALALFHSFGATKTQVFLKLRFMTALPLIMDALRISTSLSVVGAVVGEFVGANAGIGFRILSASYRLDTDIMFAATALSAAGGVLFFGLVSYLDLRVAFWTRNSDAD